MGHDIFLSHSSKDKTIADAACAVLEQRGLRCWIAPRDIRPSDDWGEAIINAIEQARALVLVFSGNANASPQVRREVERAINRSLPVIPFRIEDIKPSGAMEFYLSTPHWLDAFSPPVEQHLGYLADTMANILKDAPAPVRPPVVKPLPFGLTRRQLTLGGGAAAAGLGVLALARPWEPPSWTGEWTLESATISASSFSPLMGNLPIADLITWAYAGKEITGTLTVSDLGRYTTAVTGTVTGTVRSLGRSHNWGRGARLSFANGADASATPVELDVEYLQPQSSPTTAAMGYRKGDIVRLLQETGKWQSYLFGQPDASVTGDLALIAGRWRSAILQSMTTAAATMTLEVKPDGAYVFAVETAESGLMEARDGQIKRTPDNNPMPVSGNYEFDGSDVVSVSSPAGTFIWQRA